MMPVEAKELIQFLVEQWTLLPQEVPSKAWERQWTALATGAGEAIVQVLTSEKLGIFFLSKGQACLCFSAACTEQFSFSLSFHLFSL